MTGFLVLEDGTLFRGECVGAPGFAFGEAVFTTAMTGYQEIATDPSYSEQIVAFTAPMVGNYGVARERAESARPHARGVLMREARGPAWTDWLVERGLPALSGIDTRSLVLRLREGGAMRAALVSGDASVEETVRVVRRQPKMAGRALATQVSTPGPYVYSDRGRARVAVVDYGCKRSILRRLAKSGAAVTVFPHDADPGELERFDGVVLSNGPGDPEPLAQEVETVKGLLGRVPILGICLGHQLLALALGGRTYKMPFGHRGTNQPVKDTRTGRVEVTSHNHGFAVDPDAWRHEGAVGGHGGPRSERSPRVVETAFGRAELTHWNLNDATLEGFRCLDVPALSVQYHPEAAPGPHDAGHLFGEFRRLMAGA